MVFNTLYSDPAIMRRAKKAYDEDFPNNVMLEKFFQRAIFITLQNKLYNAKYSLKFDPYEYRYKITKSKEVDAFLKGEYFKQIVERIFGIKKFKVKYEVTKFEAGDFTLLHDEAKEAAGIDFIIDFSKEKGNRGHIKHLDEKQELVQINVNPNSLTFVNRNKEMKYIKYVSYKQKTPIVRVIGTILFKKQS